MNLIENLERYTKYANGNESCAGELVVEDEVVNNVDFSKYDLNNSYFGGVTFNNCDFSNVYLSGSNFGGSIINKCNFKDNQLVKAEWDDMHFIDVVAIGINAFRTTFMYGDFTKITFKDCSFTKCIFDDSSLDEVRFENCRFESTSFNNCKFKNVFFLGCDSDRSYAGIEGVYADE